MPTGREDKSLSNMDDQSGSPYAQYQLTDEGMYAGIGALVLVVVCVVIGVVITVLRRTKFCQKRCPCCSLLPTSGRDSVERERRREVVVPHREYPPSYSEAMRQGSSAVLVTPGVSSVSSSTNSVFYPPSGTGSCGDFCTPAQCRCAETTTTSSSEEGTSSQPYVFTVSGLGESSSTSAITRCSCGVDCPHVSDLPPSYAEAIREIKIQNNVDEHVVLEVSPPAYKPQDERN